MKKIKKDLVIATFLDHAMTNGTDMNPVRCEVVGFLVKEDKDAIYLASWICDDKLNTTDTEIFAIVKHKALKLRRLNLKG